MGEMKNLRRCIILGGGEILDYAAVSRCAREADFVVCADSGYRHCGPLGICPDIIVGDFDSLEGGRPENIPLIELPADKDYTDSDLAVKEAVSRGYGNIIMAGMTGGRPDHTFANLQILAGLSVSGIAALLTDGITDYRAFTAPVQGNFIALPPKAGHYFSVFSLSGLCERVNIHGAKYPLRNYSLRFDEARAVSNEFLGGDAVISLERGTILIITTPKKEAFQK